MPHAIARGRSRTSTFDANKRAQARDAPRKPRMLGCRHDCSHVLVGAGRLLRDAARGWAADQDALRGQLVDDGAAAPAFERGMPGERAAGTVAR